jgi:hypothetical protein
MSKIPNLNDLSFDAVIPSALLLNENIEPNAIKLYAFVRGLTKAHGYCYATNEYLAACMKLSESQTRTLLKSLEDEKFIRKKFDPETGNRQIYLGGGVPEIQQGGAGNPAGGCRKSSTRYKDSVLDKDVLDNNTATQLAEFLLKKIKEINPKNSDGITQKWIKDFQSLLKIRSKDDLEKVITWIFHDPFWQITIVSPSGLKKNINKIEPKMNQNHGKECFKAWNEKLNNIVKGRSDISLSEAEIRFHGGVQDYVIKFTDHDYKKIIVDRLMKMNISIEGL